MTILKGKVIIEKFGTGSKSEHDAVYIDTGGNKYKLKKQGGNPFYDPALNALVGKMIEAEGNITPYFFEITKKPKVVKGK